MYPAFLMLSGPEEIAEDAVGFWGGQLGRPLPDDLDGWLRQRARELQQLWGNVGALNRTRGMWREVSAWIEDRDPTNAWARNYDRLYVEAQVLRLVRTVIAGNREEHISLKKTLGHMVEKPEILGAIRGPINLVGIVTPADPIGDRARLTNLVQRLLPLRNKRIAHTELESVIAHPPDWVDIDRAIDGVNGIFRHYAARVTGVNFQIDDYSDPAWNTWKRAFTEPLLRPEG